MLIAQVSLTHVTSTELTYPFAYTTNVRIDFIKNWYNITKQNICISFSTSQNSKSKQIFAEGRETFPCPFDTEKLILLSCHSTDSIGILYNVWEYLRPSQTLDAISKDENIAKDKQQTLIFIINSPNGLCKFSKLFNITNL